MKIELDKRIDDIRVKLMTCFNIDEAKQYVGQQGYFTSDIDHYRDLALTDFRILDRVDDDEKPFCAGYVCYPFFLPAEFVRPVEEKKKWRQFTLDEFLAKFPLLSLVTCRTKSGDLYTLCFTGHGVEKEIYDGVENEVPIEYVVLGGRCYDFEELLNKYELQDKDGKWTPFGVEE